MGTLFGVDKKPMETERLAAAHYRVERETTGMMMRKRQRKKASQAAAAIGQPGPEQPHDVVRIFDRAGDVVLERDWGTSRPEAIAHEARIVDDLLHLDVLSFRARYGIESPDADAPATDPPGSGGPVSNPGASGAF